jgi:hypothetical protein
LQGINLLAKKRLRKRSRDVAILITDKANALKRRPLRKPSKRFYLAPKDNSSDSDKSSLFHGSRRKTTVLEADDEEQTDTVTD